jgi:hypothetical protein
MRNWEKIDDSIYWFTFDFLRQPDRRRIRQRMRVTFDSPPTPSEIKTKYLQLEKTARVQQLRKGLKTDAKLDETGGE